MFLLLVRARHPERSRSLDVTKKMKFLSIWFIPNYLKQKKSQIPIYNWDLGFFILCLFPISYSKQHSFP